MRKGVNEITKAFDKNQVEFVIIAADCDPIEIVMTLPAICQEKSIPYCFICSKHALGRSCGIIRPVVAAAVIHKEGSLLGPILEMKDRIEQLFIWSDSLFIYIHYYKTRNAIIRWLVVIFFEFHGDMMLVVVEIKHWMGDSWVYL